MVTWDRAMACFWAWTLAGCPTSGEGVADTDTDGGSCETWSGCTDEIHASEAALQFFADHPMP